MSGIARESVEILVHITAASLGQNDARYRALAQAYLDFQPATRRKLDEVPIATSSGDIDIQADSQLREGFIHSSPEERESEASWQPHEEHAESLSQSQQHNTLDRQDIMELLESPQLSFNSVMDNRASPVFRGRVTCHRPLPEATPSQNQSAGESWQPPKSVVADSKAEMSPVLAALSSPTRILEVFLQDQDSSQGTSSPGSTRARPQGARSLEASVGSESASLPSPLGPVRKRNQEDGSLEVQNSNEIASLPPPFGPASKQNQKVSSIEAQGSSENPLPSSSDPAMTNLSHSPVRNPSKPTERALRSKSPNAPLVPDMQPDKKRKLLAAISDEGRVSSTAPPKLVLDELRPPQRPIKKQRLEPASSPIQPVASMSTDSLGSIQRDAVPKSIWSDLLEIHPPPPLTSTGDLKAEMLISPKLHKVAKTMSLALYDRLLKRNRELIPMERGYWLVHCGTWSEALKNRCWNFLGNLVGNGHAGWGVWCIRDARFETMRVYCWGIVVVHIYLVLLAASETKIRGTEPCWIAGDGETIIKMPS